MKKPTHGGPRKGAGRKPGKKAYVNTKPNPTKVMRVPLPLVEHVQDIIIRYYESIETQLKK
jgi:hypothetical protein